MTTLERDIHAGRLHPAMSFSEKVWAVCARVERGRIVTYGDIAAALGARSASRAVGAALGRNPYAPAVPCHRVVAGDGRLTGFAGGLPKKAALLRDEGVAVDGDRVRDVARFRQPL